MPEVTKLAELLLVLPVTNAVSERSFSAMKRIKTYLKNTTSGNRLNHSMLLHVHCKKTDQLNMIEITKGFVGDNQARLRTFGRFLEQKNKSSMFNVISNKNNMRQYFCHCFSLLLVNDLKLISRPSNEKKLSTPLHNFFYCFSLLFVKDLKLDFSSPNGKKLPAPLVNLNYY